MLAPHERRLPLVLAGLAAGVSAAWVVGEVLGLAGLSGRWPGMLAAAALGSAVVTGRLARALPAAEVAEDPFAFLEGVEGREPVAVPAPRGTWHFARGFLAVVGALTLTAAAVAGVVSVAGPTLRNLLGSEVVCLSGRPPAPPPRSRGHLKVVGYRHLKAFAESPRGAGLTM